VVVPSVRKEKQPPRIAAEQRRSEMNRAIS
jgi:hypothetical protein